MAAVAASSHAGSASAPFTINIILNGGGFVAPAPAPGPGAGAPIPVVTPPSPSTGGNTSGTGSAGNSGGSTGSGNTATPGTGSTTPADNGGTQVAGGGAPVPVTPAPVPAPAPAPATELVTSGFCTSGTQSQANNAQVRVVCTAGPFVTITPMSGPPLTAAQYDESRRVFSGPLGSPNLQVPMTTTFAGLTLAAGTVTSVRVFNLTASGGAFEMLVSF